VEAYSPLIEKIAREKYNSSDSHGLTYNDFISEALITALQCAKNFNPYKSKKIIRFSNYVSRPISSSLYRMATKSKPQVSTPISVISKAKKWSHSYFDMLNKGLKVTDEEVSSISGVDMTQKEVFEILDLSTTISLEDIDHPSIQDYYILEKNSFPFIMISTTSNSSSASNNLDSPHHKDLAVLLFFLMFYTSFINF